MPRFILISCLVLLLFNCEREDEVVNSDPVRLNFSSDSVKFDTIFSSKGSTTHRLWVYNPNDKAVKLNKIALNNTSSSRYRLYIDGIKSKKITDKKLLGNDSLLILIEITIDPQDQELPYLVKDKLLFENKNLNQEIPLVAWGQDAHFIEDSTLAGCPVEWDRGKPYVITKNLTVPSSCKLTVKPGVKVLFNTNASMKVEGTLKANGNSDSLITFADDNLDGSETELFGYWKGIEFMENSSNNSISYARIKNAVNGISSMSTNDGDTVPEISVDHTILKNMEERAVKATGTDMVFSNCLLNNCARNLFYGSGGGNYYFYHCTLANYGYDFSRSGSSVELHTRYESEDGNIQNGNILFHAVNTILWGSLNEEFTRNEYGSDTIHSDIAYSLLKTQHNDLNNNNNIINKDPEFEDSRNGKFQLSSGSPALEHGKSNVRSTDLKGNNRNNPPDAGAYEKQ